MPRYQERQHTGPCGLHCLGHETPPGLGGSLDAQGAGDWPTGLIVNGHSDPEADARAANRARVALAVGTSANVSRISALERARARPAPSWQRTVTAAIAAIPRELVAARPRGRHARLHTGACARPGAALGTEGAPPP